MPTWETPESIIQQSFVLRLANSSTDKNPFRVENGAIAATNSVATNTIFAHVWIAARKHIRSWFPKEILHALSEEEGECKGQGEAHPAGCRNVRIISIMIHRLWTISILRRWANSLFHSQNFLLHINDFGVFGLTVGPGTNKRQTKKIRTAGTTRDKMTRREVEI
jgi:hypothetical protein